MKTEKIEMMCAVIALVIFPFSIALMKDLDVGIWAAFASACFSVCVYFVESDME